MARKARELPALQEAISKGELTVSKAARITSVIDDQNQQAWVELAKTSTKREIEKAVAEASPRAAVPERVRDLLAQKSSEHVSLEEALRAMAELFLDRHDPVRRARRRSAIPAHVKHAVFLRDQGRCQHQLHDGRVCGESRWIDLHHLHAVKDGGGHEVDNLTVLCKRHHAMRHV